MLRSWRSIWSYSLTTPFPGWRAQQCVLPRNRPRSAPPSVPGAGKAAERRNCPDTISGAHPRMQYGVFPVLLMKTMLFGTQTSRFNRVRHVVVDEMQDYSMVQYELLRLLFPCSMTILGDVSQQFDGGTAACSAPEAFLNDIRVRDLLRHTFQALEKRQRGETAPIPFPELIRGCGMAACLLFLRTGGPGKGVVRKYDQMILQLLNITF